MMVGYAENHDGDVYCTERVHIAHDIIWSKQMMFQKPVEEDEVQMLPDV